MDTYFKDRQLIRALLEKHPFILMEAAISEPLRRAAHITIHPELGIAPLIYDQIGGRELKTLYRTYMAVAKAARLPFLIMTPTWRANAARVKAAGIGTDINADAVHFVKALRAEDSAGREAIIIGGLMGCKHDCYRPDEGLSASEAEQFHAWQIDRLADAGVDVLIAQTLPKVEEAVGIAKAMERSGRPYIISFVIGRDGRVLDGSPLVSAIARIDAMTQNTPIGYMVNCSYPSFLGAADQPAALFNRLIGYQANASSLDHADLDNALAVHAEDVSIWGAEMIALHRHYGLKILGGCCGTGAAHLRFIVENI